jgi:hypothetical protein
MAATSQVFERFDKSESYPTNLVGQVSKAVAISVFVIRVFRGSVFSQVHDSVLAAIDERCYSASRHLNLAVHNRESHEGAFFATVASAPFVRLAFGFSRHIAHVLDSVRSSAFRRFLRFRPAIA